MNRLISEIAGLPGAYYVMQYVASHPAAGDVREAVAVAESAGVQNPEGLLSLLSERGLIQRLGSRLFLSAIGARTFLLTQAINGRDLAEVLPLLRAHEPTLGYDIVREGMTRRFIIDLHGKPDFGSIYICSPWINLEPILLSYLADALSRADRANRSATKILVITRPDPETSRASKGAEQLESLGAEIVLKSQLHSKLYIREPSTRGGLLAAIFGSQNLTRSNYLELGIYIRNDTSIVRQLIRYFFDIYSTRD